jgi:primosomal protein N' (replication factor Y)
MLQVAGRAGRKHEGGKVLIQAQNTAHPVLREVVENDFFSFIQRELQERHQYKYPPYYRLIRITLKHKRPEILNEAAQKYGHYLYAKLGDRLRGPAVPYVSRVRGYYIMDFLIKLEQKPALIAQTKLLIAEAGQHLMKELGYSTMRIQVDVDPG